MIKDDASRPGIDQKRDERTLYAAAKRDERHVSWAKEEKYGADGGSSKRALLREYRKTETTPADSVIHKSREAALFQCPENSEDRKTAQKYGNCIPKSRHPGILGICKAT